MPLILEIMTKADLLHIFNFSVDEFQAVFATKRINLSQMDALSAIASSVFTVTIIFQYIMQPQ